MSESCQNLNAAKWIWFMCEHLSFSDRKDQKLDLDPYKQKGDSRQIEVTKLRFYCVDFNSVMVLGCATQC